MMMVRGFINSIQYLTDGKFLRQSVYEMHSALMLCHACMLCIANRTICGLESKCFEGDPSRNESVPGTALAKLVIPPSG